MNRFWPSGCVNAIRFGGTGNGPSATWLVVGASAWLSVNGNEPQPVNATITASTGVNKGESAAQGPLFDPL